MSKTAVAFIEDPLLFDAYRLIQMIEQDPEAFSIGQRNDDIVNWFFAKRIYELKQDPPLKVRPVRSYLDDFDNLKLTEMQLRDLREWESSSDEKIIRLHNSYGHIMDPKRIQKLWIPVYYNELVKTEPMF